MKMTKRDLAALTGYTYRRLLDIDAALPDDKKFFVPVEDGKQGCDAATFVQRWVAFNVDRAKAKAEVGNLDEIRANHEKVKTKKTQLEVDRLSGQLISVADVKKLWGDIISTVTQNLIYLPSKVSPMLLMMDNTEQIAAVIDIEVRSVLETIAETPLPDYAQETGGTDEEEGEDVDEDGDT